MRTHLAHPINFCRAEPYFGTPLQTRLRNSGALFGSYLGYDYRIGDDRTELLFRISAAVFRERCFRPDGVANRYMGLGYNAKVLEHFYDDATGERERVGRRAAELTRSITVDTASYLERALELARTADLADKDSIERRAALLGLEIAASDAHWQRELDQAYAAFDTFTRRTGRAKLAYAVHRLARGVAIGASLALGAGPACGGIATYGDGGPEEGGDAPNDQLVVDPPPTDGGFDGLVGDPVVNDGGTDGYDGTVVDAPPFDAGRDVIVVDPPPPPFDAGKVGLRLIDQWRDTAPRRTVRSDDLPFSEPPEVHIRAWREGDVVVARLEGGPDAVSVRWQAEGTIEGEGREVRWRPDNATDDTLRVAVRSLRGLAVVSVRARAVKG